MDNKIAPKGNGRRLTMGARFIISNDKNIVDVIESEIDSDKS